MAKKLIALLMMVVILLSACNSNDKTINNNQDPADTGKEIEKEIEVVPPTQTQSQGANDGAQTPQGSEDNIGKGKHTITVESDYKSHEMDISILGAEVFKTQEGKLLKDQAPDGQEYLVIYLEINNKTLTDEYFNYNYVESNCDGKEIKTTYLLNDPKEYKPIFNTIPAEDITKGYLVYGVPEGWEKVEMTYTGWKDTKQLELVFSISADKLKDVE